MIACFPSSFDDFSLNFISPPTLQPESASWNSSNSFTSHWHNWNSSYSFHFACYAYPSTWSDFSSFSGFFGFLFLVFRFDPQCWLASCWTFLLCSFDSFFCFCCSSDLVSGFGAACFWCLVVWMCVWIVVVTWSGGWLFWIVAVIACSFDDSFYHFTSDYWSPTCLYATPSPTPAYTSYW